MKPPVPRPLLHYAPAAVSGLLMVLIFPQPGLHLLAWVCMVPLVVGLCKRPQSSGLREGIVTGTVYHAGLIYWIVVSMSTFGGLPLPVSVLLLLLFASFLSLFVALPVWCSCFVQRRLGLRLTLTLPVCWVSAEYVKSWILTGFPWELLGYAQYENLHLIQLADITGVYGVSFLLVSANCALAAAVSAAAARTRPQAAEICIAAVLLLVSLLYGHARLQQFSHTEGRRITTLLVQPNIPQDLKWDPAYLDETMQRLMRLSTAPPRPDTDLVIWPESATPFFYQTEPAYHDHVSRTLEQTDAWLLFGSPSFMQLGAMQYFFNSAFLMLPDGTTAGKYDKVHLVPWGEYVPLQTLFPFINRLVAGIGDFSPGATVKNLSLGGVPFATLICYEIIFPDLTRRFIKSGGRFIVNITNDAWFGRTGAPYQNLSMAALRAAENKRYIVRAANTGISACIAPTGEIIAQTELFTETALPATIQSLTHLTVYTRYGDIFAGSCLAAALALVLLARRRHTRRGSENCRQHPEQSGPGRKVQGRKAYFRMPCAPAPYAAVHTDNRRNKHRFAINQKIRGDTL